MEPHELENFSNDLFDSSTCIYKGISNLTTSKQKSFYFASPDLSLAKLLWVCDTSLPDGSSREMWSCFWLHFPPTSQPVHWHVFLHDLPWIYLCFSISTILDYCITPLSFVWSNKITLISPPTICNYGDILKIHTRLYQPLLLQLKILQFLI